MRLRTVFTIAIGLILALPGFATNYYFNSVTGDERNLGNSTANPFRKLEMVSSLRLDEGDSIFLAAGSVFSGSLKLFDVAGHRKNPIVISSYQPEKGKVLQRPIIDAKGFLNGILLENCSHIIVKDLEITASWRGTNIYSPNRKNMRCGVLVKTSVSGNFGNITLQDLSVQDVFFEERGFKRGDNEVKTANGKQNYGWGIRFINSTDGAILEDLTVESCVIKNVAHTGLKFTGKNKSIHNIKVLNNKVIETGGPGIQMSGVHKGHVKNNIVNRSGSNDDSRKWGRGSGLWTWGTSDVIIEHNTFKNANGPGDSAGCHIDYNCNNVIVQYNVSENNAGGFCEILGNNFNCAYRYNLSINDGHREKGKDGAFQEGKIFWLSGYQGQKKRSGPFNSYIYNNTIYVSKDIVAKIAVDKASSGVLIANNIFYIEGESKAVLGDQYNPEKQGVSRVKDIVFQNNLYLHADNWPGDVLIQDRMPIYGNPQFANTGSSDMKDYLPRNVGLIKNKGICIKPLPNDSIGLFVGLEVERDIMGNEIEGLPDLGAIELNNL